MVSSTKRTNVAYRIDTIGSSPPTLIVIHEGFDYMQVHDMGLCMQSFDTIRATRFHLELLICPASAL